MNNQQTFISDEVILKNNIKCPNGKCPRVLRPAKMVDGKIYDYCIIHGAIRLSSNQNQEGVI